jgi:hypothetical protein
MHFHRFLQKLIVLIDGEQVIPYVKIGAKSYILYIKYNGHSGNNFRVGQKYNIFLK